MLRQIKEIIENRLSQRKIQSHGQKVKIIRVWLQALLFLERTFLF